MAGNPPPPHPQGTCTEILGYSASNNSSNRNTQPNFSSRPSQSYQNKYQGYPNRNIRNTGNYGRHQQQNLTISKGSIIIMLNFLTGTTDMSSSNRVHSLRQDSTKVATRGTHPSLPTYTICQQFLCRQ